MVKGLSQCNILGLLKKLLEVPGIAQLSGSLNQGRYTLTGAMKAVLLIRQEHLQVAVVQCLLMLLQQWPQSVNLILQDDIPG